jgi:hypothetical protein|tara:strand:+ start:1095 stop:1319 length:225 start_codon:yes stop_codon:yes gene_type:complete
MLVSDLGYTVLVLFTNAVIGERCVSGNAPVFASELRGNPAAVTQDHKSSGHNFPLFNSDYYSKPSAEDVNEIEN